VHGLIGNYPSQVEHRDLRDGILVLEFVLLGLDAAQILYGNASRIGLKNSIGDEMRLVAVSVALFAEKFTAMLPGRFRSGALKAAFEISELPFLFVELAVDKEAAIGASGDSADAEVHAEDGCRLSLLCANVECQVNHQLAVTNKDERIANGRVFQHRLKTRVEMQAELHSSFQRCNPQDILLVGQREEALVKADRQSIFLKRPLGGSAIRTHRLVTSNRLVHGTNDDLRRHFGELPSCRMVELLVQPLDWREAVLEAYLCRRVDHITMGLHEVHESLMALWVAKKGCREREHSICCSFLNITEKLKSNSKHWSSIY